MQNLILVPRRSFRSALVACLFFLFSFAAPFSLAWATITFSGNVEPAPTSWTTLKTCYVGRTANGALTIDSGSSLGSYDSYIGYDSGVIGMLTVNGHNTSWLTTHDLHVGFLGSGTLNITTGGYVHSSFLSTIGYHAGSAGIVKVDGMGSQWSITNGGTLFIGYGQVGYRGRGILNITGGGSVITSVVDVASPSDGESLLVIDVGRGSSLAVGGGAGSVANRGKVRYLAGAGVEAGGPYTPIAAGTWSGSGIYQAIGGTLDTGTHQFMVSEITASTAGTPVTLDLAIQQRALISDSESSWSVKASFLAAGTTSPLVFAASVMDEAIVDDLQTSLGPERLVLGAWDMAGEGEYGENDPVYLSFHVGSGHSSNGLAVWRYDGTVWSRFDALDLTYDGTYASFTVSGFGSYAVAVPEPATMTLLSVLLLAGLLRYARMRR